MFLISKININSDFDKNIAVNTYSTFNPARAANSLTIVKDGECQNLVTISKLLDDASSPLLVVDRTEIGNIILSHGDIRFSITKIYIDDNPTTNNRALAIEWFADGREYISYIYTDSTIYR